MNLLIGSFWAKIYDKIVFKILEPWYCGMMICWKVVLTREIILLPYNYCMLLSLLKMLLSGIPHLCRTFIQNLLKFLWQDMSKLECTENTYTKTERCKFKEHSFDMDGHISHVISVVDYLSGIEVHFLLRSRWTSANKRHELPFLSEKWGHLIFRSLNVS